MNIKEVFRVSRGGGTSGRAGPFDPRRIGQGNNDVEVQQIRSLSSVSFCFDAVQTLTIKLTLRMEYFLFNQKCPPFK